MHKRTRIFQVVLITSCTDVAFLVEIALHSSTIWSYHYVVSNVKLSPFVKQRLINILLNDIRFFTAVLVLLFGVFQQFFNLLQVLAYNYPISSITKLSRLDNPSRFSLLFRFFIIIWQKSHIFIVLQALHNVKCHRNVGKLFISKFCICRHRPIQSFFISDHFTVLQMISHLNFKRIWFFDRFNRCL